MRRREFLGLVGGAAAYPLAARAQQPNRPVVAVLSPVSAIAFARNLNALRAGFRDLDYTEGRNLSIEIRYAGGAVAQLPSLAAELVGLKPDAIMAGSVPAITATHSLTRTIPVVMAATTIDPTSMGLAASLAKPGGNVTGFWTESEDALIAKRLELLKDIVPGIARVGLVINPTDPTDKVAIEQLPRITRTLNLDVRVVEIDSPSQFESVLTNAARDGLNALCISHAPLFFEKRETDHRFGNALAAACGLWLPRIRDGWWAVVLCIQSGRHLASFGRRGGQDPQRSETGRPSDRKAGPVRVARTYLKIVGWLRSAINVE